MTTSGWPITIADVLQARTRIKERLHPTPLRSYAALDAEVGHDVRLFVKHENHQPTQSFKVRNALSAMTMLSPDEAQRGVVGATRGNHGAGLAWAGQILRIPVTICVPKGNSAEKNEAMRGLGATLIEKGNDYDAAVKVADKLVQEQGMTLVHSTNNRRVIAGAATMALEMIAQQPMLDALVLAVGGGSQAVGALTVARAMRPGMEIYAVQAAEASAMHDSWHAKDRLVSPSANTFADGLATRGTYDMTYGPLMEGLSGFVKVTEAEIAEALRMYLRTTHNLAEGAAAAGLAGVLKLRETLAGKSVGVCLSGGNIDSETLRRVLSKEL
ncbi:MAG TPA: threonine/serine dehydratase [Myxococcales bacterium]|nr:threonine/serine dehydratase [Myxococcales bacterium]